jgi:hypothetical protein
MQTAAKAAYSPRWMYNVLRYLGRQEAMNSGGAMALPPAQPISANQSCPGMEGDKAYT